MLWAIVVRLVVEGRSVEGRRDGDMSGGHSRKELNYVNLITMDEGVIVENKSPINQNWLVLRENFFGIIGQDPSVPSPTSYISTSFFFISLLTWGTFNRFL